MTSCPHCNEPDKLFRDGEGEGVRCLCGWRQTVTICHACRCKDGCGGHLEGTDKKRRVEYCENCRVKEEAV